MGFGGDRADVFEPRSLKTSSEFSFRPLSPPGCHYEHLEIHHERFETLMSLPLFGNTAFNDDQFGPAAQLASTCIQNCDGTIIVPIV